MAIDIYTDGSYRPVGKASYAGASFVYKPEGKKKYKCFWFDIDGDTNNRAELIAIIRAFEHVQEEALEDVTIHSDSAICVNGINEWCKNWKSYGWKKSKSGSDEPKNLDLWKEWDRVSSAGKIAVKVAKIKAHAGHEGNEKADVLANRAAYDRSMGRTGVRCHDENVTVKPYQLHPLLTASRLMANVNKQTKGVYGIYTGNETSGGADKAERHLGVPNSTCYEGLVLLDDHCQWIANVNDMLTEAFNKHKFLGDPDDLIIPATINLSSATTKALTTYATHDKDCMYVDSANVMQWGDGEPTMVASYKRVPQMYFQAVESIERKAAILRRIQEEDEGVELVDITDKIVDRSGKKPKIILGGDKSIVTSVDILAWNKDRTIDLTQGTDFPAKNIFVKLLKLDPDFTVNLVVHGQLEQALRYSVLVKSKGAIGLFDSPWANYMLRA